MDPSQLRQKFNRFRILIIGRANAGKTTILQRVCKTKEKPEVYNRKGKKIKNPPSSEGSRERGLHNIENEMVFRTNPGFIFHDSCGFEAGGQSEFNTVKAFILNRSKKEYLKDRIHVICWHRYCIPMDEESRCFTEAEFKFFSECDTGSIPVIVLFTKFDALYDDEFVELTSKGVSRKDAQALASQQARESFDNGPQVKMLYDREGNRRPPKCHICLPDMDKDDADCGPLIERTAETLDDGVLKQLFISTQQTNLELCMIHAIISTVGWVLEGGGSGSQGHHSIVSDLVEWFPYISDRHANSMMFHARLSDISVKAIFLQVCFRTHRRLRRRHDIFLDPYRPSKNEMWYRLHSLKSSGSSVIETMIQLASAAAIILERSFYIWDQQRHLQAQQEFVNPFDAALEQYEASPNAAAVRKAVSAAMQKYEFKRNLRMGLATLSDYSERVELIDTVVEVTLQHRLPKS